MACITLLFMHLLSQPLQLTQQLLLLLNVSTAYQLFVDAADGNGRKAAAVAHLNHLTRQIRRTRCRRLAQLPWQLLY